MIDPLAPSRCVATCLTDDYAYGFVALVTSILKENPAFDLPVLVLHNERYSRLSAETRDWIGRYYAGIRFVHVDEAPYAGLIRSCTEVTDLPEYMRGALLKLEILNMPEFDVVLFLDSDILCLGSFRDLWACPPGLSACRDYWSRFPAFRPFFNTGVLLYSRPPVPDSLYADLLAFEVPQSYERKYGPADQAVLNSYVWAAGLQCNEIPARYNTTKRYLPDSEIASCDDVRGRDVVFLHYVSEKPWNPKSKSSERAYAVVESLWEQHLFKNVDRPGLLGYVGRYKTKAESALAKAQEDLARAERERTKAVASLAQQRKSLDRLKADLTQRARQVRTLSAQVSRLRRSMPERLWVAFSRASRYLRNRMPRA